MPRSNRLKNGLPLLILILCIIGCIWLAGTVVQQRYGHDAPLFLDGAWKMAFGQKPNRDFYAPLGVFIYLFPLISLHLIGRTANILPLSEIFFFVIITILAYAAIRDKFAQPLRLFFPLFVGLIAVAPRVLGMFYYHTSYAMFYNRWGYALLIVLIIYAWRLHSEIQDIARKMDSFISGILLAILLLLKITYFAVGFFFIIAICILNKNIRGRTFAYIIMGFVVTLALLGWFISYDFIAYVKDLRMAATARTKGISPDWIEGQLVMALPFFILSSLVTWGYFKIFRVAGGNVNIRMRWKHFILWLFFVGSSIALYITNAEILPEMPLLALLALLYLQKMLRNVLSNPRLIRFPPLWISAIATILLAGRIFIPDAAGLIYAIPKKKHFTSFHSRALQPLFVVGDGGGLTTSFSYTEIVNDGLFLLRKQCRYPAKVQALDFTNPFPFALGWPSPTGVPTSWQANITLSERSYPSAPTVFQDTDILLVPKQPQEAATTQLLLRIYGEYIKAHFILSAQSKYWMLWRANN